MQNKKIPFYFSWTFIIIMLFIFWPAACVLGFMRMKVDRAAIFSMGPVLKGAGGFSIFFGIVGASTFFSDADVMSLILAAGFIALGIWMFRLAKKNDKKAGEYKQILNLIANSNIKSIDALAAHVGISDTAIIEKLNEMIDIGYLSNYYIDLGSRTLVLNEQKRQEQQHFYQQTATVSSSKVVQCSSCGANNTVYREGQECEFCGNPLHLS